MITLDLTEYMTDMVYELVSGVKRQGNELIMRCPICGDSKKKRMLKRGHWYIKEGMYYCFNGGCPAGDGHGLSGLKFLSILSGQSIPEVRMKLIQRSQQFSSVIKESSSSIPITINSNNNNNNSIDDLFNDLKEQSNKKKAIIKNKLLDDYWTESLPEFVQTYLNKRKIFSAPYLPKDYHFFYDKKDNRLVIPWEDDFYQCRALSKKDEDLQGKYKFPLDVEKNLFGLKFLNTSFKYIFLLEGVFDAIFVKNGIAIGGLNLSNFQKTLLDPYYSEYEIVLFMDNQWCDTSSYEKSLKILTDTPYVKIFIWPNTLKQFKDVNDTIVFSDKYLRLWSNEQFLNSRIFSGVKGLIELKLNK